MIALILQRFRIALKTQPRREADRLQVGRRGAAHLFDGQQLAGDDIVGSRELLAHAGAKELAEDDAVQVAMDAPPATALEVVQSEFLLGSRKQFSTFQRPKATRSRSRSDQPPRPGTRLLRKYLISPVTTLRATSSVC